MGRPCRQQSFACQRALCWTAKDCCRHGRPIHARRLSSTSRCFATNTSHSHRALARCQKANIDRKPLQRFPAATETESKQSNGGKGNVQEARYTYGWTLDRYCLCRVVDVTRRNEHGSKVQGSTTR